MPKPHHVEIEAAVDGLTFEAAIPVSADSAGEAIVKALAHGAAVAAARIGRPIPGGPDTSDATLSGRPTFGGGDED